LPFTKNDLKYKTQKGIIKHFYGFEHTLGGVVSINASDFEKINGFPNFWAWGYEDNLLQKRAKQNGLIIDRSKFYNILDKNFINFTNGITRNVNRSEFDIYMQDTKEGINTIDNLLYYIDKETDFVNVTSFDVGREENLNLKETFNLKEITPYKDHIQKKYKQKMRMVFR
jgi:hypothetical protein